MSQTAARAAAATAIATTLIVAAAASASPPPKSLTNQFPLGTQTLSQTATTSRDTSSAAGKQSSPAPKHSATAPAPTHAATARAAPTSRTHSGHDGPKGWILIALVSSVIVAVLVDRLVLPGPPPGSRRRRRSQRADAPTGTGNLTRTVELTRRTPDPFEPPASERAKRPRPRRDDRPGGSREEREPPPLIIRRRPD
jgi:hypothetical protein